MVTINDGQWSFQYQKGQALYANQTTFDALSSFLDFYANIIIGFDWDTWEEFGGTKYFRRAQDIINLGASSSNAQGWQSSSSTYNRWGLVNDILAEKYSGSGLQLIIIMELIFTLRIKYKVSRKLFC
jgi:hypothetical protein